MRATILASSLICSLAAFGQDAAKPDLTAEDIIEKSIQASGGRDAMMKMTSLAAKGSMEIVAMGGTAATEMYAKAPDKRLNITTVEGYGEVKQGYDGKIAWSSEPQNGLVDISGDQLSATRRESQFNAELRWKDLYKSAAVTGKEKAGDRDCWAVKFTPAEGKPINRCYDAETFLVDKVITSVVSPEGPAEVSVLLSDYRDIGNGTKQPYTLKITMPGIGDLITKYKEYLYNVDLDDAKFAKPKN
ncbi:MAG TPA: hypothetical protein VGK29_08065 [Paludibaculum sp.]|jgi:hypothetical protein